MWDWFDSSENGKGLWKAAAVRTFWERACFEVSGCGGSSSKRVGEVDCVALVQGFFPHFKHCEFVDVPLLQAYIILCYGFCHVSFTFS